MKKRIFVCKKDGLIYFTLEGGDTQFCCNPDNWKQNEIFEKLVAQGADANLLEEFQQISYCIASRDLGEAL